jgi:alpha-tubulin suppressor-like RCC1 family protein
MRQKIPDSANLPASTDFPAYKNFLVLRGALWLGTVAITFLSAAPVAAAPPAGLFTFGLGLTASSPVPSAVTGLPAGITAIAAGCSHDFALAGGTVYAWGLNQDGQLGDGTTASHSTPQRIAALPTKVVQIAAGCHHSLALTSTGQVWSWGENGQGELGDGTNSISARLTPVHVAALDSLHVVSIAAGGQHSAAVTRDGSVYAWGDNRSGQLGSGDTAPAHSLPVKLTGLPSIAAVSLGPEHSLFLATDHTLLAAGLNDHGQLGDGTTTSRTAPVTVAHDVRQASAGDEFSVAVTTARTVLAWGRSDDGQLGTQKNSDRSSPAAVVGVSDVVSVAAGGRHVLAATGSGGLLAWGDGRDGQLGNGDTAVNATPTVVTSLAGVIAVAAGDAHSLVLTSATVVAADSVAGAEVTAIPDTAATAARTILPAIGAVLLAGAITARARRRRQRRSQ